MPNRLKLSTLSLDDLLEKYEAKKAPQIAFEIGRRYQSGKINDQADPVQAADWYEKAAEKDFPLALYHLALLYQQGDGVQENQSKAFSLLKKAAELNHIQAQYQLGIMYKEGKGILFKNLTKAEKWLAKCSQQKPSLSSEQKIIEKAKKELKVIRLSSAGSDNDAAERLSTWVIKHKTLKLDSLLAETATSLVYKARWKQEEQEKLVAIKTLRFNDLSIQELSAFKKEAEIMAQLQHPNIVSLYGVTYSQPFWLVMEFMPCTLQEKLATTRKIKWNVKIEWAKDIARGLAYLHAQGWTYRDLKSPNILIAHTGQAKIADFGLTRKTAELEPSHKAVGTTQWMAPECFNNQPVSNAIDIFSFGMVLWELASHKIPYQGHDEHDIPQLIKDKRTPAIPENTPAGLAHLIQQCWGEPAARPTAPEVEEALKQVDVHKPFHLFAKPRDLAAGSSSELNLANLSA